MMRLWRETYSKAPAAGRSAVISVAVHVVLIAAAVGTTGGAAERLAAASLTLPQYRPPPDPDRQHAQTAERVRYVGLSLAASGTGAGDGGGAPRQHKAPGAPAPVDSVIEPPPPPALAPEPIGTDSIFTELEVDSAAVRDAGSAAPAYPQDLLKNGVEGLVVTRYVVDSTGLADTTSVEIVRATCPAFAASVRVALSQMHFSAAKIGTHRVRQLVEQQFVFRIDWSTKGADSTKRKPAIPAGPRGCQPGGGATL